MLAAGWAIYETKTSKPLYAEAAGHKIYKQDVKDLIHNHKGISDRQAATVLADKYLTEALAKQEKIATVTNKDVEAVIGSNAAQLKTTNPYSYQLNVNQLYFDRLQAYNRGIYKGKLLVAHFSRFIEARPDPNRNKAAFPQFGDPTAIAKDKKYAQDFITKLYDQLQAGKITWSQAIQAEHSDPILGENGYPALSHSGSFDTSQQQEPLFVATSALGQVPQDKAGRNLQAVCGQDRNFQWPQEGRIILPGRAYGFRDRWPGRKL